MTERLTEDYFDDMQKITRHYAKSNNIDLNTGGDDFQRIIDKLSEYETAEEEGRLVVLPCKVGDIVHFIDDIDGVYERTAVVTGIEIDVWGVHIVIPDDETASVFSYYEPEEFGETIFLTKEAAEAALKEMEEKHE